MKKLLLSLFFILFSFNVNAQQQLLGIGPIKGWLPLSGGTLTLPPASSFNITQPSAGAGNVFFRFPSSTFGGNHELTTMLIASNFSGAVNTFDLYNSTSTSLSALGFRDFNGQNTMSIGYANPTSGYFGGNITYTEISDYPNNGQITPPPAYLFIRTGYIDGSYQSQRVSEMTGDSAGIWRWYARPGMVEPTNYVQRIDFQNDFVDFPNQVMIGDANGEITPGNASLDLRGPQQILNTANFTTSSTINALGSSSTGDITVASSTGFPHKGTAIIDSEMMAFTTKDATTLTITSRGLYSTTGATHSNGSNVAYAMLIASNSTVVNPYFMISSVGQWSGGSLVNSNGAQLRFPGVILTNTSFKFSGSTVMSSAADGTMLLQDNAGNNFNRLQLGGTTSSYPSLQRSGTTLVARLADDSAAASISALTATLVNVAADTAHTDATICRDTTSGLLLVGTGTLGICLGTSGNQFKTAFRKMEAGLDEIMKINLWNYRYINGYGDNGERIQYGSTAQDIAKVLPDLVRYNDKNEAINYDIGAFIPISLHAIQQLKADNNNLRFEIEQLKRKFN
jgi:hypothetical protein